VITGKGARLYGYVPKKNLQELQTVLAGAVFHAEKP